MRLILLLAAGIFPAAAHDGPEPHDGNFPATYTANIMREAVDKIESAKKDKKKADRLVEAAVSEVQTAPAPTGSSPGVTMSPPQQERINKGRGAAAAAGRMEAVTEQIRQEGALVEGTQAFERQTRVPDRIPGYLKQVKEQSEAGAGAVAVNEALGRELSGNPFDNSQVFGRGVSVDAATVLPPAGASSRAFGGGLAPRPQVEFRYPPKKPPVIVPPPGFSSPYARP